LSSFLNKMNVNKLCKIVVWFEIHMKVTICEKGLYELHKESGLNGLFTKLKPFSNTANIKLFDIHSS